MLINLSYNRRLHAFRVGGTGMLVQAPRNEADDVIEYLRRKLCDNPSFQAELGCLGAKSVEFEVEG